MTTGAGTDFCAFSRLSWARIMELDVDSCASCVLGEVQDIPNCATGSRETEGGFLRMRLGGSNVRKVSDDRLLDRVVGIVSA